MKKIIFLFFALPFISLSQIPTNGLSGAWIFSGNANDLTPNANNGIVNGATLTTDRYGIANRAYHFDGINDEIRIPSNPLLYRYNTSFSISAWVRQTAFPAGFTQPIFTNRNPQSGSEFYIDGVQSTYGGYLGFASYNGSTYGIGHSMGPVPINNGYQHVVMVYKHNGSNNNTVKLYINGVLDNTTSGLINITLSTEDTYIGWSPHFTQTNRHFDGDIDDIFMYNRELTDIEIIGMYNNATADVSENIFEDLIIYPIPATNVINIKNSNKRITKTKILSLDGKTVFEGQFETTIDVSNLNSGMYIITFMDSNNEILKSSKFTKE